jgi:TatD DNase family protein
MLVRDVVESQCTDTKSVQIGINFTDPIFRGEYHGTKRHEDDFEDVIQRALDAGCKKFMITGSDLEESKHAIEISKAHTGTCYATVGVHPCSAKLFDTHPGGPSELLSALRQLALEEKEAGHAVAFGEIGLDYDRLFLTPKEQQLKYFEAQLEIAVEVQLPLFLHSRAASEDFERLLKNKLKQLPKRGLVHSFTGTAEEMQRLVVLGFDIGVNGCSMKSELPAPSNASIELLTLVLAEENIEVVKQIPLERLQIETDGPWVGIKIQTGFRMANLL